MLTRRPLAALLALALLAGCVGAPPAAPTATPVATLAPVPPTSAPVPRATATATVSPLAAPSATSAVVLPPPTATPRLPTGLIDAQSAARLAPLRTVGLGELTSAAVMPDRSAIVALTTAGLAWYTLPDLAQVRLDPVGAGFDLQIAPTGTHLAYTELNPDASDGSVIRRTADGSLVAQVEGLNPIFSADGALVATGSRPYAEQQLGWLWDVNGQRQAELAGGTVSFSPAGAYVAAVAVNVDRPSVTRVYEARGGAPLLEIEATSPAFRHDDRLVAVSRGGQVEVYALPEGELYTVVMTRVEALPAFSADGSRLLIVVGADLWVWDLAANRQLEVIPGVNRAQEVFVTDGPRFGPVAATLASFEPPLGDCSPGGVTISATGEERILFTDDVSYAAAFAPSGDLFALSAPNGLRLVDPTTDTVSELPLSGYEDLALSPDGATLAVSSTGTDAQGRTVSRVELWDLLTGEQQGELLTVPEDFVFSLSRLAFSPDGTRLSALAGYGCAAFGFWKVVSWELGRGAVVSEILELPTVPDADGNPSDGLPPVFAIAPDGAAAAWVDEAGQVVLRAANGEEQAFTLEGRPTALAFNAFGLLAAYEPNRLAYIAVDGVVPNGVWSTGGPVRAMAFSPDGEYLVALFEGGSGEVRRTRDFSLVTGLNVPASAAAPSISLDGAVVAVGEPAGLGLYDGASGALIGRAAGAPAGLIGPGRRLAATLSGGRVTLWGAP